jgi:hypothetical protein
LNEFINVTKKNDCKIAHTNTTQHNTTQHNTTYTHTHTHTHTQTHNI